MDNNKKNRSWRGLKCQYNWTEAEAKVTQAFDYPNKINLKVKKKAFSMNNFAIY
jgi:hypothetical protein